MITAKSVKELREMTGAGMMDCKKALVQTEGDIEKAVEYLREKGLAAAAKKAGRVAAEGIVKTFVSADKKTAGMVEVNCETDFVAANEEFVSFADKVAEMVANTSAANVEELLAEKFDGEATVQEALTNKIATIGENMTIRRFARYESANGLVASYIHGEGKIGVLVEMENADIELAKDVCMQIAAAKPEYLSREDVPQERVDKEIEILKIQAMNEGKPEAIAEKMVQGRIGKFYSDICLVDQEFVKNPDMKISELLKQKGAKVVAFARLERGEGIEKKEENFAEEVAKQLQ